MTRRRRDPNTRFVVDLPERDLAECLLHLAAPLLEPLAAAACLDEARSAIAFAVRLWNAHVSASEFWGDPRRGPLAELRRSAGGQRATSATPDTFALLSDRWRREFQFDPRLVGDWSYEASGNGQPRLVCQTCLPEGVEAKVHPPAEKRIRIAGRFLDEVAIRLDATSSLSFPVERHRGVVADDGSTTIHAMMPAVLQLFAEGRLPPVGSGAVDVSVGGRDLGPMRLAEVRCAGLGGDVAVLVFRPALRIVP